MDKWESAYQISQSGWIKGLPETPCGIGSTIKNNKDVIFTINNIIKEYWIKSITDLGCGDFNWMSKVNLSGIQYTGYDWVLRPEVEKYRSENIQFIRANIGEIKIPKSDLIICKDVFIHLSNELIAIILDKMHESKSKYAILSTYNLPDNIREVQNYCPVDLHLPPFNFPTALEKLNIRDNYYLNLYEL
jgi:hypothetical protein